MQPSRYMGHTPSSAPADAVTRMCSRLLAFPGEPLEANGAEIAAGNGNKKAETALQNWKRAKVDRARIAAVSCNTFLDDCQWTDGKIRATRYKVGHVGPVVHVDGRAIREEWSPAPQKLAQQLNGCGVTRGIHRKGGRVASHVMGCTSSLCPDCCRRKAGKRVGKMAGTLAALAARGYQLAHLTITQPVGPNHNRPVVLVSSFERQKHRRACNIEGTPISDNGYAVPGESLGDALDRLRVAMTALRDGQGSREWWASTVLGNVYGIEWTGHHKETRALRWHVHAHMLIVFRPGIDLDQWIGRFGDRWGQLSPGSSVQAQRLDAIEGDNVLAAVKEVLKYPFKPGDLTHAQLLEVLASTKGRRFHLPGGFLHGNSRVARAVKKALSGEDLPDNLTSDQLRLVADLVDIHENREPPEPIEVAYTAAEHVEPGDRAKSRRGITVDGVFLIPVTAAGLAAEWLQGQRSIAVVWKETGGGGAIQEQFPIGPGLLSCAMWRGDELDPDVTLTD